MYRVAALLGLVLGGCAALVYYSMAPDVATTYLENSVPYLGADTLLEMGYSGDGVTVGVIDTGVNPWHPDLHVFGQDGQLRGTNFVSPGSAPSDVDGHGTQVAGIIAASGGITGVAPNAVIYSYKVSHDGNSVSSDLIVQAIRQAVSDDIDIINISLGVNKTNRHIDAAINDATEAGVLVVVAAGNDGPVPGTIGSPGINPNAITVGASHNNLLSSLVATLKVNDRFFEAIPMMDTAYPPNAVSTEMAYGGYGRPGDFEPEHIHDKIVLVERGSDIEGEMVFFSDKEIATASAGAKALLVYNNVEGMFLGELQHEFTEDSYTPSIPTVSLSREDGQSILEMIGDGAVATLHIFQNPDTVAYFSSRGPSSPFYLKPDIVAPGVLINSTSHNGYSYVSGTSFATPHVTGAAALLLEKNPSLTPLEIKSILVTTADPASDSYGERLPNEIGGAGRLNMTRAFDADLVVQPTFLMFNLSPARLDVSSTLDVWRISGGAVDNIRIDVDMPSDDFDIEYDISDSSIVFTARMLQDVTGEFSGIFHITHDVTTYSVPFLIRAAEGAITVTDDSGVLHLGMDAPQWSFARMLITDPKTGITDSFSASPERDAEIKIYLPGTYWLEARVTAPDHRYVAYDVVEVPQATQRDAYDILDIGLPYRQLIILAIITTVIAVLGVFFSRRDRPLLPMKRTTTPDDAAPTPP